MKPKDLRTSSSSATSNSTDDQQTGLTPNMMVADYLLYKRLGRGGSAEVWLAMHHVTCQEVALKVLHPKYARRVSADSLSITDRFLNEGRMLQSIEHPGVVKVLDVLDLRPDGPVAYAMEVLHGLDMSVLVDVIELPLFLEVMAQVADHLADLHDEGIIHRDVKLSNIFLCDPVEDTGVRPVKLIDFGTAKDLRDPFAAETATGHFVGTLAAIAPESFNRILDGAGHLTAQVDQWGFGVALFHAFSARLPFEADGIVGLVMEIRSSPIPKLELRKQFVTKHAAELERIVHRCLAKLPQDRYPSMRHLAEDLRAARRKIKAQHDSDHFRLMLRKLPTSEGKLHMEIATGRSAPLTGSSGAPLPITGRTPIAPPTENLEFDKADTLINQDAISLDGRASDPFIEKTVPLPSTDLPSPQNSARLHDPASAPNEDHPAATAEMVARPKRARPKLSPRLLTAVVLVLIAASVLSFLLGRITK